MRWRLLYAAVSWAILDEAAVLRVRVGGLGVDRSQLLRDRGQTAAGMLVALVGHYLCHPREKIKHNLSQFLCTQRSPFRVPSDWHSSPVSWPGQGGSVTNAGGATRPLGVYDSWAECRLQSHACRSLL